MTWSFGLVYEFDFLENQIRSMGFLIVLAVLDFQLPEFLCVLKLIRFFIFVVIRGLMDRI